MCGHTPSSLTLKNNLRGCTDALHSERCHRCAGVERSTTDESPYVQEPRTLSLVVRTRNSVSSCEPGGSQLATYMAIFHAPQVPETKPSGRCRKSAPTFGLADARAGGEVGRESKVARAHSLGCLRGLRFWFVGEFSPPGRGRTLSCR